jgi:hypothetical protein
VDQTLDSLLKVDFGLTPDQIAGLEAIVLDGAPVDDPAKALVRRQSRLALAAGLPGVAGLALKTNSPLKGLRNSITYAADDLTDLTPNPSAGQIVLALYSLVLRNLAPHFLARGVWATAKQLRRYGGFYPDDLIDQGGRKMTVAQFLGHLSAEPSELYFLSAKIQDTLAKAPNDSINAQSSPGISSVEPERLAEGCQKCPIGCRKPNKSWRHLDELALLWGLNPQLPETKDLIRDFKTLANDLGLEAFELSGALAMALAAKKTPRTPAGLRWFFGEIAAGSPLGALLGQGRAAVAKALGLSLAGAGTLVKQESLAPEMTAFLDCLGLCQETAESWSEEALEALADLLTARYGRAFSTQELSKMGADIIRREEEFAQAGI